MNELSLPADRQERTRLRRRKAIPRRAVGLALFAAAAVFALLAWRGSPDTAADARVDAATRFDYVAVFPPGTDAVDVERWRHRVLRVHENGCFRGNPCIARSLRGAELGRAGQFAIGFDLMRDAPSTERAAVLAAAQQTLPGVRIAVGSSLLQAVE
jgi:hypothetical protein